jgi:hypothetical protein
MFTSGKDSCWIVTHLSLDALDAFRSGPSVVFKPYPGGLRGSLTVTASGQIESKSRPVENKHHGNILCYSNLQ